MPPAKREAYCNQSSRQCAEKEQMKRRGVDIRAEEHPARGSAGFYGKTECARRSQQLTEHKQSLGPVHESIFVWNCQYICTAKYCPTEITKKADCGCKEFCLGLLCFSGAFYSLPCAPKPKLHLTGSSVLWTYPDSQSVEVEAGEGYNAWQLWTFATDSGFSIIYGQAPGSSHQSKVRDSETIHNKQVYLILNKIVLTMCRGTENLQFFLLSWGDVTCQTFEKWCATIASPGVFCQPQDIQL